MSQEGINPYAPPVAQDYQPASYAMGEYGYDQVLATRGSRFLARLLDGLLELGVATPGLIWLFVAMDSASSRSYSSYDAYGSPGYSSAPASDPMEAMILPIVVMMIPLIAISIYQWTLIASRGQTLGKKWMNIRIVKQDGSKVDFVTGVILRNWVMAFISNIPYVGGCIGIANILFIFAADQQCLHDKIAKTKVVAVLPGE